MRTYPSTTQLFYKKIELRGMGCQSIIRLVDESSKALKGVGDGEGLDLPLQSYSYVMHIPALG
jgi:hypothetical protein